VLALAALFAVIAVEPGLRTLFELQALSLADYAVLAFIAATWAVVLRAIWRGHVLERLLGVEPLRRQPEARSTSSGAAEA
jgi:hypothetical protein